MVRIVVSSSAGARLDAARRHIAGFPPSTELLIVGASREAADDFARGAVPDGGASFGLHRFSFTQLAARAAAHQLALAGQVPATRLGGEALAARAAFDARTSERLEYFQPVASLPGFPRAAARSIDELRQAGVAPSSLAERGPGGRDLAVLVDLFVEGCEAASALDRAGLFAQAAEACRSGAFPWPGLPIVLLDVPIESLAERTFAEALSNICASMLATVPAGDETTVAGYRASHHSIQTVDDEADVSTDLGRLRRYIFSSDRPIERDPAGDVEIFSAPGEGRESVEIARRILEESRRGVRFDEMAVFLRSPQEYLGLLEHAFERAGIGGYFDRGTRRPDASGRAFMALLACASERLSAKRFDEYLSLGQVPSPVSPESIALPDDEVYGFLAEATAIPESRESVGTAANTSVSDEDAVVAGSLRAPWKWEELIVESAVIGGRDRWERRLTGLQREYETRRSAIEREEPESPRIRRYDRDLRNLRHLRDFALPLMETLDGWWSERLTWGDWLDRFTSLAPRVLMRPSRVLRILADLRPMAAIGPISLEEARDVLADRLLLLERQPPARRYGHVFVGSPHQARGRAFRVVFVPGLAERMFPQRLREDPLLLDEDRSELRAGLPTSDERAGTERLLLRLAVGAATERVYVSYPRLQVADSRARVPSFYLLDIVRAIRGALPDHQQLQVEAADRGGATLAWPAPADPARAIDNLEHDLSVLGGLFLARDPDRVKGRARYLLFLNEALHRSVVARWERSRPAWKPADGIVQVTDGTRSALASQRLTARPYSLSALQRYASCPYQFLLSAVFRLEPWEEPEPLQRLDPLTRGSLFHRMQAELLRTLRSRAQLPVTADRLGDASTLLDAIVLREAAIAREELAPAIERVWEDEIDEMRRDLRVWLERLVRTPEWRPEYFEFSFGLSDEGRDERSVPDPVQIDGRYWLRGSVDLIERHAEGTLRVTDHKTGKNRTKATLVIDGGRVLQPVLYSVAVEGALGARVVAGRLSYCTTAGGFTEHVIDLGEHARAAGVEALTVVDRAVELGFLAAVPADGACRWCDYAAICGPGEEARTRKKSKEQIADLMALRSRP